jgi:membrane-bound ClpP family serine protease
MTTEAKRSRWGVRTLGFLALALVCILTSMITGSYTLLTLAGVVVGLIGATVCSVRGLMSLN